MLTTEQTSKSPEKPITKQILYGIKREKVKPELPEVNGAGQVSMIEGKTIKMELTRDRLIKQWREETDRLGFYQSYNTSTAGKDNCQEEHRTQVFVSVHHSPVVIIKPEDRPDPVIETNNDDLKIQEINSSSVP